MTPSDHSVQNGAQLLNTNDDPRNRSHAGSRHADPPSENDPLLDGAVTNYTNTREQEQEQLVRSEASQSSEYDSTRPQRKTLIQLVLVTLVIGGLQIAWTVEFGSITPFLLRLGLSKSLLSLVWVAGPLSGTLVQPWVGIQSDKCRSPLGRRRPFLIAGAIASVVFLIALAWSKDITEAVLLFFGGSLSEPAASSAAQIWAVVMIYLLDFAVNTVQAASRALLVDVVPEDQQQNANAIAAVMTGLGSILGYLAGESKLNESFYWLGDSSHFKTLCAIASVALISTLFITCYSSVERRPEPAQPHASKGSLIDFFESLWRSLRSLPPQVKTVCVVEIFAWMSWFPFLFYTTTFLADVYVQPFLKDHVQRTPEEINGLYEDGKRVGAHGMFLFSVTSLVFSIALPLVVASSRVKESDRSPSPETRDPLDREERREGVWKRSLQSRLRACSLHMPWLTLRRAWMFSHVTYALLMWLTLLARTPNTALILVALTGFPWAMTQWAPYAFIAREIGKADATQTQTDSPVAEGLPRATTPSEDGSETPEQHAGVVLGIHNVAVAAPQVMATLISSVVFRLLQKPRGVPGDESTGWVLRAAGISALAAAWWTRKIIDQSAKE